jgi:ABC-2 type transport system permease protein
VIAVEAFKQIRRGRTLLALVMLGGIPVLMGAALALAGGPDPDEGPMFLSRVTSNGLFLPISAVAATSRLFLLVVAALFLGEGVSSETTWGTERYVLIRPVTRRRYLLAKVVVGQGLVVAAVVAVAAAALAVGWALFGLEPFVFFGTNMSVSQTLGRIAAMVAFVSYNLLTVGSVGLLVAIVMESSAGAVVGAVGVGITSQILDAISALGDWRRFLPTHYWEAWFDLFRTGAPLAEMRNGVILTTGYSLALLLVAFWIYENKDIRA